MAKLKVPANWDHTCDILIVGGGTAGLPAAIVAAKAGNKVTVLELTNICGGSGNVVAGGGAFAGTDEQKKLGIEDNAEMYYEDGIKNGGGDPAIWRVLADNQLDCYNWLQTLGLTPEGTRTVLLPPGHSAPRLHHWVGTRVMGRIEKEAKDNGVEILFQHRALRLYADPATDRVYGARVETKDGMKNFKARKAVILAAGSFSRNKDMVYEYGSKFVDCVQTAAPGHLGDGLKMAFELGAKTSHIGDSVVGSLAIDVNTGADRATFAAHEGGIYVNVHGKRFTAENAPDGFYGQVSEHFLDQPGKVAWVVYGTNVRDMWVNHFSPEDIGRHKEYVADSIEELAKVAGIDSPANLVATVKRYNEDIDSEGYDTEFNRKHLVFTFGDLLPIPDQGPYYAVKVECCTSSMKGGLKTNTRFQVLNNYDEAIPGLYSAGEINGGLWSRGNYMGGVNFGGYLTFGRVVGMYASQEAPWDK